ncbi:Cys/Met metabolism PLP-dependent enzyme-domain-containing protein [Pisolithus thermaeus]|nr:Cys/Met metabolism PLP-dependent enzyme-domain-containing protein [Pisolithus thermaeus]
MSTSGKVPVCRHRMQLMRDVGDLMKGVFGTIVRGKFSPSAFRRRRSKLKWHKNYNLNDGENTQRSWEVAFAQREIPRCASNDQAAIIFPDYRRLTLLANILNVFPTREPQFETLQLHAGHSPDPTTRARAVPIYASTSFVFDNSAVISSRRVEYVGEDVFEDRMAALEGGVAAVATSSGQSAQLLAISTIASSGDNIVATRQTYNQFKGKELDACVCSGVTFKKFGIGVRFVSGDDPEAFEAAIDEKTKAIYVESIGNPKYNVAPIPDLAKVNLQRPPMVGEEFMSVLNRLRTNMAYP